MRASCHVPPLYTEPGWNMHAAAEIGIDDFQASRAPDLPLSHHAARGTVDARRKGGYYHDGRFATLPDVIRPLRAARSVWNRRTAEVSDIAEFLKSLPNE